MKVDYVAVNNIEGLADLVNNNSAEFVKHIDKLEKQVANLIKSNNRLAVAGIFLAAGLYLLNKKTKNLELKVKNLETVNNFMKGENRDEDTLK